MTQSETWTDRPVIVTAAGKEVLILRAVLIQAHREIDALQKQLWQKGEATADAVAEQLDATRALIDFALYGEESEDEDGTPYYPEERDPFTDYLDNDPSPYDGTYSEE